MANILSLFFSPASAKYEESALFVRERAEEWIMRIGDGRRDSSKKDTNIRANAIRLLIR